MAGVGAVALAARTATPVSAAFPTEAYDFGGGKNIVNVTLVDIRAWDTLGEISVLVVAATGVASLIFLRRRTGGVDRLAPTELCGGADRGRPRQPRRRWLPASATLPPERRSVILEVVTRLLFHTILVFSLYLLFSGHNEPGGGFAGGLVAGLALVVRYLAGGRYELDEAAPVDAGRCSAPGCSSPAAPAWPALAARRAGAADGDPRGRRCRCSATCKLVTSLFFDIGVYLIVVGLVLDILRSLGAELDRQDARRTTRESSDPDAAVR